MAWHPERDENQRSCPRRMRWIPEAEHRVFREAEERRVEENRRMRYVEPSPYRTPARGEK